MAASELEIARARMPGVPDAVLVESMIERFGRQLDLKPPADLHLAASYQQIKHIRYAEMDWAGMLTPSSDGTFTITVRASDRSHRKNFTIGHEITHTFLPGYTVVQKRCGSSGSATFLARDGRLEALADVGAAVLLLPRRFLRPVFADTPFSIVAMKRIADSHHASLDATLRQLLHLIDRSGIVVDLRQTSDRDGGTQIAVHRVFSNSPWCAVAPSQLRGTQIPESHPLCAVFDGGPVDDILDLSLLRTTTRTADISALTDPYTDNEGNLVMRSLVLATPHQYQPHRCAMPGGPLDAVLASN
ncbi:ImmA/IrrE family metallo-endopeptidase [Kribbella kalugense]|uniref:Uncharacterized protein DUF955 n=1 Tax=Kribbella kalugense TaxID=2512221 RepID=A0A4R7ZNK2_9ACTN|nr:ImmA/IrrE family metallo-endopeptidase [Kribbella kalugense]TDW19449.1 uncharacterized protein DUF955 [Kribbella kalugense]